MNIVRSVTHSKEAEPDADKKDAERLSQYLVRKGVLSSRILEQLQKEFLGESNSLDSQSKDRNSSGDKDNRSKHTKKRNSSRRKK